MTRGEILFGDIFGIMVIVVLALVIIVPILYHFFARKKTAVARYLKNGNEQEGVSRNFQTMPNPQTQNISRNPVGAPVRPSSVSDYIGFFVLLDKQDRIIRLKASQKPEEMNYDLKDGQIYQILYRGDRLIKADPVQKN
ncbi:MAG: hypothetical protein IIY45_10740 [Firmicutes bacterium]|nr:hypothetical protein [Bacillota bacterium]MBR3392995.1 hypothetical protein [Bacillota bacterium]